MPLCCRNLYLRIDVLDSDSTVLDLGLEIFLYQYKVGDILMATEKTREPDLLRAVTKAKALLDPLRFILTGNISYADTSLTPDHYIMESNDMKKLDPKIMVECCFKMDESLNYTYKIYRKENMISLLELRVNLFLFE
ncbi:GH3 family - like 10 [Theobroma cacao]|nr:GH3 family - like 10 [Theobroma cacao]